MTNTNQTWVGIIMGSLLLAALIISLRRPPSATVSGGEEIQGSNKICLGDSETDRSSSEIFPKSTPSEKKDEIAVAKPVDLPVGSPEDEALIKAAVAWASQSPTEAVAWASQIPRADARQRAMLTVAAEVARSEPTIALTVVAGLPPDPARDDLVVHAAAQWAATEPANAAEWAEQIPDTHLRQRVVSAVATEWGGSDPIAAAQLALQTLPPGRAQDDAVIGIVQRWNQAEPEAVAAWVGEFPAGQLRKTAMAVLADTVDTTVLAE
jgi:hypothetical protein